MTLRVYIADHMQKYTKTLVCIAIGIDRNHRWYDSTGISKTISRMLPYNLVPSAVYMARLATTVVEVLAG